MRVSIRTFIFILSEFSIISAENCKDPPVVQNAEMVNNVTSKFRLKCNEGYKRKAGTSNLFKCENNTWRNSPTLECILLDTLMPPVSPSPSTSAKKTDMAKHPGEGISTTDGTTVFTTTHNPPTTSRTFHNTSKRTTMKKEMSLTTSATDPSTTEIEKLTTLCIPSSSSTTERSEETSSKMSSPTEGIAAGIVIIIILGAAATVAIFFCRRRSRRKRADSHPVEMPIQNPVTPFKDNPENTYTDATFSA